ncbi:MAG: phosphotransferase, partial [Pseudomonadales bacterium]
KAPPTRAYGLPLRLDPLPEVLDFLPEGDEWQALRDCLQRIPATAYTEEPKLLHGDYWPENILWQGDRIAAVLDWEDAAIGDPLSDVAAAGLELRYKFGVQAMHEFTRAYAAHQPLDSRRLALWRIYVAAAAQRYMGAWGLEPEYEAHMRSEALACIREAGEEISVSG